MSIRSLALKGIRNSVKFSIKAVKVTRNVGVTAGKASWTFAKDAKASAKQGWTDAS